MSDPGYEAAWIGRLTVEVESDGFTTIYGYAPGMNPPQGDLDVKSFSHQGESFVIKNLFLQQVDGGMFQIVLELNQPLPHEWYFQAKSGQFAVSDSLVLGSGQNIHA